MPIRMLHEWCCYCPQLDLVVCGGLPQRNNSSRVTRKRMCECWWFGNRFLRRIGASPAEAHWRELRIVEHDNFGIPNILWPKNSRESRKGNRTNRCRSAALGRGFIGMRSRFMRRTHAGMLNRYPCIGTDLFIESPRLWEKR